MTEPQPQPESAPPPERAPDWEAFYRDYRKPGYVSGFEITTKLGGGMFGLVFRARKQSIGKDYAIKFLKVDDGEVRRAVLAELEQVRYFAQVDHPNLVQIEDRGEVDGIPYLVMTFAGTETLRDRMPTDGVAPAGAAKEELLRYFLQCCRGLAALHERSLVHFDIKPANVFLKGSVARLGDYGLSKLVTHSRGSLSMGRGTPYYMAPEMLQRRGDHRSDVYSLGVMLYELLCGKVPFTGDSEWEVLKAHETAQPELPAHLTGTERAVLQRCLQKDPDARFQDVHDLIAAFGAAAGVGAAAWQDVRAGAAGPDGAAQRSSTTPPPLPKVPPPPIRSAMTPAERLADDAKRRAQQLADQAVAGARKAVHVTHTAVREQLHGHGGVARMRSRMAARRAARQHAAATRPPHSAWRTALTVIGSLALGLVVLGVLAVWLLMASPAPMVSVGGELSAPQHGFLEPPPMPVNALGSDHGDLFDRLSVPSEFTGLISPREPGWVALAEHDRSAAARALEQRFDELRRAVPFELDERVHVRSWPMFRSTRRLPESVDDELASLVDGVLRSPDVDADLVARTVEVGPVALAALARRLDEIPYTDLTNVELARRLHATLERATGCREIEFVRDGHIDDLAQVDRPVGKLWLWFLHEVAHNERTWRTYRSLRGGR